MSNEEKILKMLGQMQTHIERMDTRIDQIDTRIERMDTRIERMDTRIDQIDTRSRRTAVLLETEVDRKLNLLYEGHEAIMEYLDKIPSKERVDALESDVIVLKNAVKMLTQEIAGLKKPQ